MTESALTPLSTGTVGSRGPASSGRARSDLKARLRQQLRDEALSPGERRAAEAVIDALDEHGFLRATGGLDGDGQAIEREAWEDGVKLVQELEPPGVGARNLREWLTLQLLQLPPKQPGCQLALQLLRAGCGPGGRAPSAYARRHGFGEEELNAAVLLIEQLCQRPEARNAPNTAPILVVDAGGQLEAIVNPLAQRRGSLAAWSGGRGTQSAPSTSPERNLGTLRRVAQLIVDRQQAFLEGRAPFPKPLRLRDVARELSLHESTVSRAISNRVLETPRGSYRFRWFFSSNLSVDGHSAGAVRELIGRLIASESPDHPLPDAAIVKQLEREGVRVARRTVAKYRRALGVQSAARRHHGG